MPCSNVHIHEFLYIFPAISRFITSLVALVTDEAFALEPTLQEAKLAWLQARRALRKDVDDTWTKAKMHTRLLAIMYIYIYYRYIYIYSDIVIYIYI